MNITQPTLHDQPKCCPTCGRAAPPVRTEGVMRGDARDTSRAAARSITVDTIRDHHLMILDALRTGGMTDEELQHRTRIEASSQRPRRGELVRDGLVVDSGARRPTSRGRQATVWEITPAGRVLLGRWQAAS